MEFFKSCMDILLHLDTHLNQWVALWGNGIYVLLFAIIFCETGLVVLPFLPGDSLLFAVGALSAGEGSTLSLPLLLGLLGFAAILGNLVNYTIGRFFGKQLFRDSSSRLFRREYLERAEVFYKKYGGKAIVLTRFVPILRTFAPFVAGMAGMNYPCFILFNVAGGLAWIFLFLGAGHFFGNLPAVKTNFHLVILAILVISVLPMVVEWLKARKHA